MLVEGSSKVHIQLDLVADRFAKDPPNELEVSQVIWIDIALLVGLEHIAIRRIEQGVVDVEHLFG
jgi:hypothetical protein